QVLKQEAERSGRIRHRISAVQHHKTVEIGVVLPDELGEQQPVGGRDVAAVDGLGKGQQLDVVGQLVQLGHQAVELAEGHRHQLIALVDGHAN
nr:hypothetical protein [Tanacetum cinerariifolium]